MNENDHYNVERLLAHLSDGSLARLLVDTYSAAKPEDREGELKRLIKARQNTIRETYNVPTKD